MMMVQGKEGLKKMVSLVWLVYFPYSMLVIAKHFEVISDKVLRITVSRGK